MKCFFSVFVCKKKTKKKLYQMSHGVHLTSLPESVSHANRPLSPLFLKVRTVSAKALGAMVKGMGESCFDDLLPWLMETLASEQSSVDRSGAAQGGSFSSPMAPPEPPSAGRSV